MLYCELAWPKRLYTMMTNLENTSQIVLYSNLLKGISSLQIICLKAIKIKDFDATKT
jgi:hypothetical protein